MFNKIQLQLKKEMLTESKNKINNEPNQDLKTDTKEKKNTETKKDTEAKRKLPVAPTSSGSSGSKDPAMVPTKKIKTEENEVDEEKNEKSWWDTNQYQRQNNEWYQQVKKFTDEGHRSGNCNKLLLLVAHYELQHWDECTRLIRVYKENGKVGDLYPQVASALKSNGYVDWRRIYK